MLTTGVAMLAAIPAAVVVIGRAAFVRESIDRVVVQLVAVAHIVALVALTIFPLPITPEAIAADQATAIVDHNFVPFATVARQLEGGLRGTEIREVLGNGLLLVPLGFYAPILWRRMARPLPFLGLAVGYALAIELCQLAISTALGYPYRVADADDVIVNSAGAMVAFGVSRLVAAILP